MSSFTDNVLIFPKIAASLGTTHETLEAAKLLQAAVDDVNTHYNVFRDFYSSESVLLCLLYFHKIENTARKVDTTNKFKRREERDFIVEAGVFLKQLEETIPSLAQTLFANEYNATKQQEKTLVEEWKERIINEKNAQRELERTSREREESRRLAAQYVSGLSAEMSIEWGCIHHTMTDQQYTIWFHVQKMLHQAVALIHQTTIFNSAMMDSTNLACVCKQLHTAYKQLMVVYSGNTPMSVEEVCWRVLLAQSVVIELKNAIDIRLRRESAITQIQQLISKITEVVSTINTFTR